MALEMSAMFGRKKAGGAQRDGSRSRPAPKTVMMERPDRGSAIGLVDRLLSFRLPFIGDMPVNTQVQVLLILLGVSFLVVVAVIALDNRLAANGTLQTEIVGDTLMHTQRLAKAAPNAVTGNAGAFVELKESRDAIASNLDALTNGDDLRGLSSSSQEIQPTLARLADRWKLSQSAASVILANEKALLAFGDVIKRIERVDAAPAATDGGDRGAEARQRRVGPRDRRGGTTRHAHAACGSQRHPDGGGHCSERGSRPDARARRQPVPRPRAGAAVGQRRAAPGRGDGRRDARAAAGAAEGLRRTAGVDRRRARRPAGDRAVEGGPARDPGRLRTAAADGRRTGQPLQQGADDAAAELLHHGRVCPRCAAVGPSPS